MRRQLLTIARFTILEALHTRLVWVVLLTVLCAVFGSLFIQAIAITENLRMQTSFLAATTRLLSVFLISLYVLASMNREFNDKGLELFMSLSLKRATYLFGKFFGYAVVALVIVLAVCIPLLFLAPPYAVTFWAISLYLELCIAISLSLLCVITFNHLLPATTFVFAFYLLARAMAAIQLVGKSALLNDGSLTNSAITSLVDMIAFLLPRLDLFTQTSWLVNSVSACSMFASITIQSLIYISLLLAIALFDLYRKTL